jgi:hypothetical protein
MTISRRSFIRRAGLATASGAFLTALTALFPEIGAGTAYARPRGSAQDVSVEDCSDPRRCEARCKCNNYKTGKCQKYGSQEVACWCTNDNQRWHAAPSTCL